MNSVNSKMIHPIINHRSTSSSVAMQRTVNRVTAMFFKSSTSAEVEKAYARWTYVRREGCRLARANPEGVMKSRDIPESIFIRGSPTQHLFELSVLCVSDKISYPVLKHRFVHEVYFSPEEVISFIDLLYIRCK
jgi:hypothetical protein